MLACAKALFLGSLRIIPIFSLRGWCKSTPEKLLVDPSLMTLDRGHGELDDGTVEMLVSDFFFLDFEQFLHQCRGNLNLLDQS